MNASDDTISHDMVLGQRIKRLRLGRAWTLEQLSQFSGLARSTLSKIENGQMSPTYDALLKLAGGLQMDLGALFAPQAAPAQAGRRSVNRSGDGLAHSTPHYEHVLLCNELSQKDMIPFKSQVVARSFDEFEDWSRHDGEEFVYVLSGEVTLYTEFYEPTLLAAGDSWYIDSRLGHRVISRSAEDAQVLWVSTTNPRT
ncbi:helix-turn-helix domain-containing protein [Variovorax ginsengisoli]|uniref:Transcriptional regulator with XRE-family HTH domain n=1 Tax=Variovorax ginsengisoli TaxID=363844 RepID=A0ABT9SER6_9BURK|nr:XRE family transcriptional regulator [Variovorax ginsengisoli]MDP9902848.1 transcriptional regulator with XRE-family HTH domain [Variovorax ginsengisoli]